MNRTCLIVGCDRLGKFGEYLNSKGFTDVLHWTGREGVGGVKVIPLRVELVIVTGYCQHDLMHKVKRLAMKQNIPVIYVKNGIADLEAETSIQSRQFRQYLMAS